jgi:maltoporin
MICGPGEDADQTVFRAMNMKGYDPNMRAYADNYIPATKFSTTQKTTFSTYKDLYPIGNEGSFYTRIDLHKRVWHKGMYFYPVPYAELQKSRLLVQNPLW